MGIEHFAEGAGADHLHLLGVTKPANVDAQRNQLYTAEYGQGGWIQSDEAAGKKISLNGARDLVGEAIHHHAMDEIPGIENVRANYAPKTDVAFNKNLRMRDARGRKRQNIGGMVTDEQSWSGKPNRLLINPKVTGTALDAGGVTHEATHMILHGGQFGGVGHNWAMARLHVHLVRKILGNESANALKEHYDKNGVDFGGGSI